MDKQTERKIVECVEKVLRESGLLQKGISGETRRVEVLPPVTLAPLTAIEVEAPHNLEALKAMRASTPARILMGRTGARQKTTSYLHYLADHAAAQDAVYQDVSEAFIERNHLMVTQTLAKTKDDYLQNPELGKRLDEASRQLLLERCEKGKNVQVVIADGLSSTAIETNVEDVLPALMQGLKAEGLTVGTPFFVRYGRVGIQDEIGRLLNCDIVVELVGERPGLITAESMSAYIIYRPNEQTVEADRTVISNIHRGGTPPVEAGAHMATVVKKMLTYKASGVKLSELLR